MNTYKNIICYNKEIIKFINEQANPNLALICSGHFNYELYFKGETFKETMIKNAIDRLRSDTASKSFIEIGVSNDFHILALCKYEIKNLVLCDFIYEDDKIASKVKQILQFMLPTTKIHIYTSFYNLPILDDYLCISVGLQACGCEELDKKVKIIHNVDIHTDKFHEIISNTPSLVISIIEEMKFNSKNN